jgi:DNA helicase-2/ATP-dependent DNA helicase PcrA
MKINPSTSGAGADISNILNFEKHFPNAKIIRLNRTIARRDHSDVAGAVVKRNVERKGKKL